jgi:hypothetical protein
MGFVKKFLRITGDLAFTYAGSTVVLITLSGETRRLAFVATVTALVVHYIHQFMQNDD